MAADDDTKPTTDKVTSNAPLDTSFGRRNPHCSNCGDERGGDFGHEAHECQYRPGMTTEELAKTMSVKKAGRYWDTLIDRYLERELGGVNPAGDPGTTP